MSVSKPSPEVVSFAWELARLRHRVGDVSYQELARRTRFSASVLARAASGTRLPSWPVAEAFVRACGVLEVSGWKRRWLIAAKKPAMAESAEPGTIPANLTSFVDRTEELAQLVHQVRSHRLVTVTGPGGTGKTRLAQQVALAIELDSRDGIRWVDLTQVVDAQMLARLLLTVTQLPADPNRTAAEQVLSFLAERELILVLDNCEHVTIAVANLARRILLAAPQVRILATSRHSLGLPEEHLWTLGPLHTSAAVRLLTDRARTVVPGFVLDDHTTPQAMQACRILDGSPLAIEFAARRLRALTVEQLVARLDDVLTLLSDGDAAGPIRHQSLQAMLEWSWSMCAPAERRLWSDISVFAGDAGLDAIEAVNTSYETDPVAGIAVGVSRLCEQSIVTMMTREGQARYSMLEMVRQFGLRKAKHHGWWESTQARYLSWARDFAERFDRDWFGSRQPELLISVKTEMPNLEAAMEYGLSDGDNLAAVLDATRLARSLYWYWVSTGAMWDGRYRLDQVLAHDKLPDTDRMDVMWRFAVTVAMTGDPRTATDLARQAAKMSDHLGDFVLRGWAGYAEGACQMFAASPSAIDTLRDATARFRALSIPHGVQVCQTVLGVALAAMGDRRATEETLGPVIDMGRRFEEVLTRAYAVWSLGIVHHEVGDIQLARAEVNEALDLYIRLRDSRGIAVSLETMAWIAADTGDDRVAVMLLGAANGHLPRSEPRMVGFDRLVHRGQRYDAQLEEFLGSDVYQTLLLEGSALTTVDAYTIATNWHTDSTNTRQ
ncbi:ATP-binding protein [Stackebrandtia nassauensis]|uniref:ATPase-like protein n=1 Tax=Stackebrandtia nassauensis (strain DSM 44728 / CIP 108903 / NRRL B-16338 / NBRC 102104 / LLR-40K-21) TaxID=446470 RepID=D3PVN1_STANL|nr:helix-turn-helix domain-containing protein [Stackebrandtia nassauensis]ADD43145.1 ATPase-like protein [Stackebrandtia nassauensis DSM 44728]